MLDLSQPIRTLGLYQPYAGLMLHGKIETRWISGTKKPPFPLGVYLLYSTKKSYDLTWVEGISGEHQYSRIWDMMYGPHQKDFYRFGSALCLAALVKIIEPLDSSYNDRTFVDCSEGHDDPDGRLVGLEFDQVARIEPFQIHGKQGVGFLSDSDRVKIKFV